MSMKTIKVAEATNLQLDWLVAKCEGLADEHDPFPRHAYTVSPDAMWPIIEREGISILAPTTYYIGPEGHPFQIKHWRASKGMKPDPTQEGGIVHMRGYSGLIAAARCYVASKLGETVEVPEELV